MLNLREIRTEKGYSLNKLSRLSGVSRVYISQIESGRYRPTIQVICKLCKGLNVTPNDLIKHIYWKNSEKE